MLLIDPSFFAASLSVSFSLSADRCAHLSLRTQILVLSNAARALRCLWTVFILLGISSLEEQPLLQCQIIQTSQCACKHVIVPTRGIMTQHIISHLKHRPSKLPIIHMNGGDQWHARCQTTDLFLN